MSFWRQAISHLHSWRKSYNRKPLIVRGARQVGKTTLVHQFAQSYKQSILLNLEKKADRSFFDRYDSVHDLLDAMLIDRGMTKDHLGDTLLFIDEIQELPKAIAMLRYFYEEVSDLQVIAAGSLLEHRLSDVKQFPVGRISYLYLFPMNFVEYLAATGQDQLRQALGTLPISDAAHHVAMDRFKEYLMIGGMPEAIQTYVDTEDLTLLPGVYESIWASYVDDVSKYAASNSLARVMALIMRAAPAQLDQRITFEKFGNSNYGSREVGEALRSLDAAGVIRLIYPTTDVQLPATPDLKKRPRLQFLDTGLVVHAMGLLPQMLGSVDMSSDFRGGIVSHVVHQEVTSLQALSVRPLSFWVREKRNSQAEVDMVLPHKGLLIPVEIKAGAVGKLRSLHQYVDASPHPYAVRMYGGELSVERHRTRAGTDFILLNLPYYLGTQVYAYLDYLMEAEVDG